MTGYRQQKLIDAACDWNNTWLSSDCEQAISNAEDHMGPYYIYDIYDDCQHNPEVAVAVADLQTISWQRWGCSLR